MDSCRMPEVNAGYKCYLLVGRQLRQDLVHVEVLLILHDGLARYEEMGSEEILSSRDERRDRAPGEDLLKDRMEATAAGHDHLLSEQWRLYGLADRHRVARSLHWP